MRVLVYEYLTGGGLYGEQGDEAAVAPLLAEGQAMADAICCDLAEACGVEVVRIVDSRLPSSGGHLSITVDSSTAEREALTDWSPRCDWTLLIAPESGRRLLKRCRLVERCGGRLLSPDAQFVALAGDKCATSQRLNDHRISTPAAVCIPPLTALPCDFPYPAVLKPCDGAGSVATLHLASAQHGGGQATADQPMRLEQWVEGTPASLAVLNGPRSHQLLPPCGQRISDDGRCRYLGGSAPLSSPLAGRASRLAQRVIDALPRTTGYVGIDLILGLDPSGIDDVVLDVNPRLTTSYVGLRQLALSNLAAAMLRIAEGGEASLQFLDRKIEFDIHGSPPTGRSHRE